MLLGISQPGLCMLDSFPQTRPPTIHVSSPSPLSPHSFPPGQILPIFHSSPLAPPPAEAFIFFLHKSICSVPSLHISTQTFTVSFLMIRYVESFFLFISDMLQFKQRVRIKLVLSDRKCRTQNQGNSRADSSPKEKDLGRD